MGLCLTHVGAMILRLHNDLLNQHFVRDRKVPANFKQTKVVPLPEEKVAAGDSSRPEAAAASRLVLQDFSDDENKSDGLC